MRSTLFFAVAILLTLGILFARERVKLAFQVGAALYAALMVARFFLFSSADPENLLDLVVIFGSFGLFWLAAWAATSAILRHRRR